MSSLSYRKRSILKDSIGGKGDDTSLFSTLKEQGDSQELASFRKNKAKDVQDDSYSVSSWRKGDNLDDRGSVISQAYSEAASRARKGMNSRWSEFDRESVVSSVGPSRASTHCTDLDLDDAKSSISAISPLSRRRSMSRLDDRESEYGSALSPGLRQRSPGTLSRADSRMSLSQSCRLSEFDVDDDALSVAFSSRSSAGRSMSVPPRSRDTDSGLPDTSDLKPVSHRSYLDPDLEAAINEVLNFKPITFKRSSLEESEGQAEEEQDEDRKSVRGGRESSRSSSSSVRRSASAVDCTRSSSRMSSRTSSRMSSHSSRKSKSKKKRSNSLDSSEDERRNSSKKKKDEKKKKKKKSKKESSSSSSSSSDDSESSSESDSSSGASTISYRSTNSIKRAPGKNASASEEEREPGGPSEAAHPRSKKDAKKRKKSVDSVMMKYLYRPDSD